MKSCPACGTALVDHATICNRCGAPAWQDAGYAAGPYPTPPSAASNKGLYIVLGVVLGGGLLLVLLAVGIGVWVASASRQARRNAAAVPVVAPQPTASVPVRPGPPWVVISSFQKGRQAGREIFTLDYRVVQGRVLSCLWVVEDEDGNGFEFSVPLRHDGTGSLAGRPLGIAASGRNYKAYLAERDLSKLIDGGPGYKPISGVIELGAAGSTSADRPDNDPTITGPPDPPAIAPNFPPTVPTPPNVSPPAGVRPPSARGPGEGFVRTFDKNGDGVVTVDDFPAHARGQFERFKATFDKDGDGQIMAEEINSRIPGRPSGRPGAT